MIIDLLENAALYYGVHPRLRKAFDFLQTGDMANIAPGKYPIDGENMFAIVREYETLDAADEEMESHKKYFDVQYVARGEELVGLDQLTDQTISRAYDEEEDYVLYADAPAYFAKLETGSFMVFFPSDLHMPCIRSKSDSTVKKIVVKAKIS